MELAGITERSLPYAEFRGRIVDNMPLLRSGKDIDGKVIDVPRELISFAHVLDRREKAPEDVRRNWCTNSFYTRDTCTTGVGFDVVIELASELIRASTAFTPVINGALKLSNEDWDRIKNNPDNLYLTAAEVEEAHRKGYIKQGGVWVPENRTVAKVWERLGVGRDLRSYVEVVESYSPDDEKIMSVYFQRSRHSQPTMRSWCIDNLLNQSIAHGDYKLVGDGGLMIGIAQNVSNDVKHQPEPLDGMVNITLALATVEAMRTGKEFTYEGRSYVLKE